MAESHLGSYSVLGMTWIQLEINQPRVFTAKSSEPQAVGSCVMGEGSGVAILFERMNRNLMRLKGDKVAKQTKVLK